MGALLDWIDRVWNAIKARKAAKAAADVAKGAEIIAQAQKEADEMREAAAAAEARKRLDTELSTVPKVIVDPQLTLPMVKP